MLKLILLFCLCCFAFAEEEMLLYQDSQQRMEMIIQKESEGFRLKHDEFVNGEKRLIFTRELLVESLEEPKIEDKINKKSKTRYTTLIKKIKNKKANIKEIQEFLFLIKDYLS